MQRRSDLRWSPSSPTATPFMTWCSSDLQRSPKTKHSFFLFFFSFNLQYPQQPLRFWAWSTNPELMQWRSDLRRSPPAAKTKWVLWKKKKKKRRRRRKKELNGVQRRPKKEREKKERKMEKRAVEETIKSSTSRVLLWLWDPVCRFTYGNAIENWVLETENTYSSLKNQRIERWKQ